MSKIELLIKIFVRIVLAVERTEFITGIDSQDLSTNPLKIATGRSVIYLWVHK